jgi:hypothetical protein
VNVAANRYHGGRRGAHEPSREEAIALDVRGVTTHLSSPRSQDEGTNMIQAKAPGAGALKETVSCLQSLAIHSNADIRVGRNTRRRAR